MFDDNAMDVHDDELSFISQTSESDFDSDSESEPETDAENPRDKRSFVKFMEDEELVEVVRDCTKYAAGSTVEIKKHGHLWIDYEDSGVVISKATRAIMKNEGLKGKGLSIGKKGYVIVGTGEGDTLHSIIAASNDKKDQDFRDLLELGWDGKKADLEVLHLNDNPVDFNVDNLLWHTHDANLLLRLSKGSSNRKKFHCSTVLDGNNEHGTSCSTLLEARHAIDILKINNVQPFLQDLVFRNGLNFKYPSLETLLSLIHLYKSEPTHQGKPFKSTGIITDLDWKHADAGLKKEVEESKIPFDPKLDVLVKYTGKNGNGVSFMFVMELTCFNKHILDQEVTLKLSNGYVQIVKEGLPMNGIHRLVLGLVKNDVKVGRHFVDGHDGKRDNRLRVLRPGSHRQNMRDVPKKTDNSTSQFPGISWDKAAQKYQATMSFSNGHFSFTKNLGRFGKKGDKTKGEKEAYARIVQVLEHVERICVLLKDVKVLAEFKRRVNEELKKIY